MSDDRQPVPDNFIELQFADGDYLFRLPIAQVVELQEKCDAGVGAIFARLMAGRYKDTNGDIVLNPLEAQFKAQDVRDTIRLGLIGGGKGTVDGQQVAVDPTKARRLVADYVDTRPLLETWRIASAVLAAFVVGYSPPDAQKKTPAQEPVRGDGTTTQAGSASPAS